MLDENGTFVRRLVYLPQHLASELGVEKGWYDDADAAKEVFDTCWNDEPLLFGQAVQVNATVGAGAKATFSGQVKGTPTVVDVENFMGVANCSPVEVKISDLIVNCDETGEGDGTGWQPLLDGIIMLDENGTFVRRLVYLPQHLASELGVEKGWYDDADAAKEVFDTCWNDKVVYAAGEGFQVSATAGAGATVTIRSALAE